MPFQSRLMPLCAALLLAIGCSAPQLPPRSRHEHKQMVIPFEGLVTPEPVVLPAPVGLAPPVPVLVDPRMQPSREPEEGPSGPSRSPPVPTASRRDPCEPIPVPHRGGDTKHDECADHFPPNQYPGNDILVGGKRFDALQVGAQVLWEIKTDRFDTYVPFVRTAAVSEELEELARERTIAFACGYGFVVGVSTQAHADALREQDVLMNVVVTGCQR